MSAAIPILLYHAINDAARPGDERWTVSTSRFREHVSVIREAGRTPVALSELARRLRECTPRPEPMVAVTFDDGFADQLAAAALLAAAGIPTTVYVTSGYVDRAGYLDHRSLHELATIDGVEVGAHSVSHPHLDIVPPDRVDDELATCRAQLEQIVQQPVDAFAYPHGSHSRRVRDAVVAHGFSSAAAVKNAFSHERDDPFAIARITVHHGTTSRELEQLLAGKGAPVAWRGERVRTTVFRQVRRARQLAQAAP